MLYLASFEYSSTRGIEAAGADIKLVTTLILWDGNWDDNHDFAHEVRFTLITQLGLS